MSAITICPPRNDQDIDTCAHLMTQSEPWRTLRRGYQQSRQMIANPPRESYLAIRETEVAGFIVINMTGAFVGYIQSICVAEQWRSQGIGTTLIHYAEARIFQEVPNASICASSFNSQARSLYERLGYSLVGELKDFVVTGHSEFLLRKTIGSLTEWQRSIPHPD